MFRVVSLKPSFIRQVNHAIEQTGSCDWLHTCQQKIASLFSRSRPNRLNFKEIKYLIKAIAELFLHSVSNNFNWHGQSLIAQSNKPFHPGHRCQIGLTQILSRLGAKLQLANVTAYARWAPHGDWGTGVEHSIDIGADGLEGLTEVELREEHRPAVDGAPIKAAWRNNFHDRAS